MTKVTRKGQVTIPKNIREKFGIKPGTSIKFRVVAGKCVIEKEITNEKIDKWIGYIGSSKITDKLISEIRGEINSK